MIGGADFPSWLPAFFYCHFRALFVVIASLLLLSLRAQRGNLGGARDCFVANAPRNDRKGCHCEPFFIVIASEAWQSRWGVRDCFVVRQVTYFLAMTGGCVIATFLLVIAARFYLSLRAQRGNLRKSKNKNQRAKMRRFFTFYSIPHNFV